MKTNTLVRGIVELVNENILEEDDYCEALLSFDDRIVPAPLTKIYLAFLVGKDNVSLFTDETNKCCQKTQITISMNCYAPPGESAIHVCALAERVLDKLNTEYGGIMNGYEIGEAVIDDYLKALKIPCKMFFIYEQCPAFDSSENAILPFADFLCKTHVYDSSVHLSSVEREKISEPFVTGYYIGLGSASDNIITLNFKPKALFIFPANDSMVSSGSASSLLCYSDIVIPGSADSFVSLTNSGFTVKASGSIPSGVSVRVLNENGKRYNYIAFR